MRKTLSSLLSVACLTLVTTMSFSQSLEVTGYESIAYGQPSEAFIQIPAVVTNNSSSDMNVMVKFEEISAGPVGSGHYFCWTVCYSEGSITDGFVIPGQHALNLAAGASTGDFYSDYVPNGTVGMATYRYTFFDQQNPSDETSIEITFDTQNVGIEELEAGTNAISESYPNPASDFAKVNYSLTPSMNKAEVVVYSMLGSKVQEVRLDENQGTLSLDVSSLPSGLYFYSLVVDENVVSTKKMMVTK